MSKDKRFAIYELIIRRAQFSDILQFIKIWRTDLTDKKETEIQRSNAQFKKMYPGVVWEHRDH